jgi:twinkle protein
MSGKCVEKILHEACGARSLQVFEREDGGYDGYCFSCGTPVSNPYKDKEDGYKPIRKAKSDQEIKEDINSIHSYPCTDLPSRSLKKEALEYFGVKIGLSQIDGETPETYHFPYYEETEFKAYKTGLFELGPDGKKRVWSTGDMRNVDLFGWSQAVGCGDRRLYITEGEFDAVALYQCFRRAQHGTQYADNVPAIVSLPKGAGNASQDLARLREKIRKHFKEVVLVFDMDEAGRKAVDKVLKENPDYISASLPAKDANECLKNGQAKAAFQACKWNAVKPKNTRLVWGASLVEAARKAPEWGLSWPFKGLTDLTRGVRFGETYYIGAGVKLGKSELLNTLAAHFILEHKLKVFMAKPEEANAKTYKLLVGKAAGTIFHDPKIPFDYEAYDKYSPMIENNVCMVNLYQHLSWENLQQDIRDAAAEGCKIIFIDPITNLTAGMESGAANTKLQEIAVAISALAMDLQVVMFLFCHLNAPATGAPHERGGAVLSQQFAGSRAMMRSCHYMLGLEGNKDPDLPAYERNKRKIVVLEDREFGNVGYIGTIWDESTGLFTEL